MTFQLLKLRKSLLLVAVFLLASLNTMANNRDSLALTPPMGFMTWNKYKEDISEQLIRQIADKLPTRWPLMAMQRQDINTSSLMMHGREGATNAITSYLTQRSSQAE